MGVCYYFDMDGVLVEYNNFAPGETLPFEVLGRHYFRDLEANIFAVSLFQQLRTMRGATVKVCTHLRIDVGNTELCQRLIEEHKKDKWLWCREHLGISQEDFLCIVHPSSKSDCLLSAPISDRRNHILIDDDQRNLLLWVERGGKAVCCVQHRLCPSVSHSEWGGPVFYPISMGIAVDQLLRLTAVENMNSRWCPARHSSCGS